MRCLRNKAKTLGLEVLDHTIVGGLLTEGEGIVGAWGIQYQTGELLLIRAEAVVLATGGMGHLFPITDNINTITGEGYALAFRAGAELTDLEMIHFLPTLVSPVKMKARHVIARPLVDMINSGARLYNGLGERFMKKNSDTGEKEKAEKQVTQAIGLEVCEGRATAHGGVYLDASDVPPELRKKIFSGIWSELERAGVDLRYQPVELAPNPHDIMGGIRIDETAKTNVPGLFAAGEAAGGSHGAARVGGSALSDALAFGAIAGRNSARFAREVNMKGPLPPDLAAAPRREVETLLSRKEGVRPLELRKSVQAIAHRYLNTVRNEEGLKYALQELEALEKEMLPRLSARDADPNQSLVLLKESIEVRGQLELAKLIAAAARFRQESRGGPFGGHYRSDFPSQDDRNWLKNVVLKNENGTISCRAVSPIMEV
jgi:fumarate reductase (CoM/CoB) subunit A